MGDAASTSAKQTQKLQKLLGKVEKQLNQLKHEHSTVSIGSSPVAASTSAGSLSMPEGSVNNPLAEQPEQDDHQTPAGLLPLSPQLSSHTVNGDKEGGTDSKLGVPTSSVVIAGQTPVTAALSALEASAIAASRATQYGTTTQVYISSRTSVFAFMTLIAACAVL